MSFDILTNENYVLYAAKHYDNPHCQSTEEFHSDLLAIKYIKRLFRKYEVSGDLRERLILNHIIIFCNMFGTEAAIRLLFFRLDRKFWSYLKTFLIFLDICPNVIRGVPDTLFASDISLDMTIASKLRGEFKGA